MVSRHAASFADEQDTRPEVIHSAVPPTLYLHAGQLIAESARCRVSTILGSCVAVCLYDPVTCVGGINHYLLPFLAGQEPSARFGHVAIPRLVERMEALGAWAPRLQAKLFGGSDPLHGGDLGQRNVELATTLLAELRIRVVAKDVGGPVGRKLLFDTHEGTVWVRRL